MGIIRVGLCNPNDSIRFGKSLLINSQSDLRIVFEAATAQEVLDAIDELTLDVLVVDHRLTGRDGLWLVESLNRRALSAKEFAVPCIVIAPYFSAPLGIAVIRSGAADFVVEESGPDELLEAIRNAAANNDNFNMASLYEMFLEAKVQQSNNAHFNLKLANLDSKLSALLTQFEKGFSDSEICAQNNFSAMRLRQLYKKLLMHFEFTSKSQLALALFEAGLL